MRPPTIEVEGKLVRALLGHDDQTQRLAFDEGSSEPLFRALCRFAAERHMRVRVMPKYDFWSGGFHLHHLPNDPVPALIVSLAVENGQNGKIETAHGFTMAHELGHARSWFRDERTEMYIEALAAFEEAIQAGRDTGKMYPVAGIEERHKESIMEEEERAWRYGKQIVEAIEDSLAVGLDAARELALSAYRGSFWPDES